MVKLRIMGAALLIFLTEATPAIAGNVARCEALIKKPIIDNTGSPVGKINLFPSAVSFLASLYDDEEGHLEEIEGLPIRAILCRRNDVIPANTDYPILATGLPFVLSQDLERSDTDSLTIYWKDDALEYSYKGHPLSKEAQMTLDTRLADFTKRGIAAPQKSNTPKEDEIKKEEEIKIESKAIDVGATLAPDAINEVVLEAIGDLDVSPKSQNRQEFEAPQNPNKNNFTPESEK
jgi:hypothetical protein